ncbi:5408_t:CDS:2, partial [Ambispora leptoticha]
YLSNPVLTKENNATSTPVSYEPVDLRKPKENNATSTPVSYDPADLRKLCESIISSNKSTNDNHSVPTPTKLIPAVNGTPKIPKAYQSPIPRKTHMSCNSYHEMNGITFDQLWEYPPISLFIGIFTVPYNFERRQLVRTIYRAQQKNLKGDLVDFRFIIGKPHKKDDSPNLRLHLKLEQEAYGDLVMLDIKENLHKDKAYKYWTWVASTYTSSPKSKYLLFAKADDDEYINFQNLALNLRPLERTNLYYGRERKKEGGGWRTGLLFVLSPDYVKWIGATDIPENLIKGPEDVVVWKWLVWGNLSRTSWINEDCLLYQDPRSSEKRHTWLQKDFASPQTIALHGLKELWMWDGVIELFHGENQFSDL